MFLIPRDSNLKEQQKISRFKHQSVRERDSMQEKSKLMKEMFVLTYTCRWLTTFLAMIHPLMRI
jgi:hypothetical protein